MEENILIDSINIKTLPELIVNDVREKNKGTKLNSVRIIYNIILDAISEDIKESYLNKIQKYLSSSEQTTILIFDDINMGIYDENLKNACETLTLEIDKTFENDLYYQLYHACYFIHFEEEELKQIEESYKKEDHTEFLFLLFKHAIQNYKVSTPKILAERLFQDASSLSRTSPLRKNLYKIAADLGHPQSALAYGTIVSNTPSESIPYFMKGKELSTSLWKIGFNIERYNVGESELEWIKKELKDILSYANDYKEANVTPLEGKNSFQNECILTAFKIYFYLANEKNYSKGYNSVGKFFINDMVSYMKNNEPNFNKNKEMGIQYLKKAISLSNIHAMQNLAIYYKKTNQNEKDIKSLLTIGAKCEDLISCVELSKILITENKVSEAIDYLEYASSQKSSYAQYHLGKIYENKFDIEKAKEYYKLAIKNGFSKAAIDLAFLYFSEYVDSKDEKGKNGYLLTAINILKNHQYDLNEEDKKQANKFLQEWEKLLG